MYWRLSRLMPRHRKSLEEQRRMFRDYMGDVKSRLNDDGESIVIAVEIVHQETRMLTGRLLCVQSSLAMVDKFIEASDKCIKSHIDRMRNGMFMFTDGGSMTIDHHRPRYLDDLTKNLADKFGWARVSYCYELGEKYYAGHIMIGKCHYPLQLSVYMWSDWLHCLELYVEERMAELAEMN